MTSWNLIINGDQLVKERNLRIMATIQKKERAVALEELIDEGWEHRRTYSDSRFISVQKKKPFDQLFEDQVWMLMLKLGFTNMNRGRNFKMKCDFKNCEHTQQIDVFAADEETVVIIECKAAESLRTISFKKEIEAFTGQMPCLRVEAQKRFPGCKVKFIWATQNINLTKADSKTLENNDVISFTDNTIGYYYELVKHLGNSARYQFLGHLFSNTDIRNMDNRVFAIRGKMGNNVYFSFSIEPAKLLKIGYVLHRNEANSSMMPTYQRLIKKNRLREIQNFIDQGGYFPNSLIISIDNRGRDLKFEQAAAKNFPTQSKIGTLYLPKKYRSAYIIDGQHRLYGYANSKYKDHDIVPVIAFVDMDQDEQVRMFMDINEKQKAVPKVLRATLDADVLWVSKDKNKQRQALRSRIAQTLGEESSSPLYGRIIIGENSSSPIRCITITQIQMALGRCRFFSEYSNNTGLKKKGSFDFENNDETCKVFYPFLEACFHKIKTRAQLEWEKGKAGILTTNRGIYALIRVFDDIISLLVEENKVNIISDNFEKIQAEVEYYLEPLITWLNDIPDEDRLELSGIYGGGADVKYWRFFQNVIHSTHSEFDPEGLDKYILDKAKTFNEESFKMLHDIETAVRRLVIRKLEESEKYSKIQQGIPKDIIKRLYSDAVDHDYSTEKAFDFLTLGNCREIAIYSNNWSELFEKELTRPNSKGSKETKTEWLEKLNSLNKKKESQYSVTQDEFEFLKEIYQWFQVD